MLPWQKLADNATQNRCTAHAAAHHDSEAHFARFVMHNGQANIVYRNRSTVFFGTIDRNFKFAWQVSEFWMECGPLTQNLGVSTWIDHFICGNASKFVGGNIAHAVTRRLNGVHFDFG